jgi:hypothetical protein
MEEYKEAIEIAFYNTIFSRICSKKILEIESSRRKK